MSNFSVQAATASDLASIQVLLNHYASMGSLLPRSRSDLEANLEHFRVVRDQGELVACASLEHFTPQLAEVRSLMVNHNYKDKGLGRCLVEDLKVLAETRGVERLMALTYVPEFFHRLGFKTVNKEIFPEKVWGICVNCYKFENCDEIAVLFQFKD